MLKVHKLYFKYNKIAVLRNIEIELDKGRIISIVGPNGAGKTTLLRCILNIVKPDKGTILIDGRDASQMKRRNLAKCLGYVPQSLTSRFPMTVFDAILMGRRPYISWKPSRKDLEVVAALLRSMDMEDIALRDFDQLSGGQKQKVLLARAVVQDTDYLLLDEPTSNLDLKHQLEVMEMISALVKKKGVGAIMAVHDLNLASRFSDTIVMLKSREIFCAGNPHSIMTAENIRSVYGVEAMIKSHNGYPYILPICPAEKN